MSQYRIIIVDDHPLVRDALKQTLELSLVNPALIETGCMEDLIKVLGNDSNADLILLDLTIPGVQGFSGLVHLREKYPQLPVAIISAKDDYETIHRCMELGAVGFMPKTLPVFVIRDAVVGLLKGTIWTPPQYSPNKPDKEENFEIINRLRSLTPQQARVLGMVSQGMLNKQIAYELGVSEATIKAHVSAILSKLAVVSRTQAAIAACKIDDKYWRNHPPKIA